MFFLLLLVVKLLIDTCIPETLLFIYFLKHNPPTLKVYPPNLYILYQYDNIIFFCRRCLSNLHRIYSVMDLPGYNNVHKALYTRNQLRFLSSKSIYFLVNPGFRERGSESFHCHVKHDESLLVASLFSIDKLAIVQNFRTVSLYEQPFSLYITLDSLFNYIKSSIQAVLFSIKFK